VFWGAIFEDIGINLLPNLATHFSHCGLGNGRATIFK
jgi:hypothetical protein